MGLFHRSRDKDSHQAVPKHQFGFRKSFKRFTGTKSTPLTPEPIAASVLRQSNASKRSPRNSIINDTSASLEGSAAASESITTISPCRQVQVADGEPFRSGLDAKTGDQVVPIEELSNLHIDGTDTSCLKQSTGDHSVKAAESNGIPCQENISTPKTLWDQAYDALRSSNDSSKSGLVADYERKVLHGLKSKVSGRTVELEETFADSLLDQKLTNKAVLDRAIEDALKHAPEGESSARSSIDKAGKLTLALQNFISEAVKASPEASLAWAGVCLVLPLLTQPVIAAEAQRNGFTYVTSRIGFWTTLERQLANAGNWTESVQDEFVTLYQHLLEFQVRTVLRYHQSGFERFVQDLQSNVWEQLITAVKDQETLLYQDLQQYHNTDLSFTLEVLKQNSNKFLESNAKFLEALQKVQDFVRKDAENKLAEKEKKCLRLFRLTDNERDVTYEWYKSRVKKRVEGTCIWAVEHENFRNWLELKSGPLLITADPGCGKSVLSKYLIDQYLPQRCPTATICYFFFKDGDQNTVKQALCALLHQLFCQKPNLINHAMEEYERNGEGVVGTTSALWGIFNNATCDENAGTIIIVLDALDECEKNEFKLLVDHLNKTGENAAKFLLTSRPYGDVLSPFKYGDMLNRFPRVLIPGEKEDQSDQISTEINHVIQFRVDRFVHKYELKDQLRDTLWAELNKTKHRTYLWVYLVFDHLKTLVRSEALKRTAQGFKTAIEKLPRTVEDAYERILNRPQGALRTTLRRVLCVILAAQRPLTLSEMQIVVNMEPDMKSVKELDLEEEGDFSNRLRTICGLFVSVHRRNVYFLHQTAREFLQAETELSTVPGSWRSSITNCQAHAELARACVQYIHILDPSADDVFYRWYSHSLIYSFLHYSASFWAHHSEVADAALENDLDFLTAAKEICRPDTKALSRWWNPQRGWILRKCTTTLCVAFVVYCPPLIKHLVRTLDSVDLDRQGGCNGGAALQYACHFPLLAKMLIDRGADVNVADFLGATPLHEVARTDSSNMEVARSLIDHHANLDATDNHYLRTPLHCYIHSGQTKRDFPGLLIENGANTEATDYRGWTALHLAVDKFNIEMARLLVEKGANTETTDQFGWTALHFAADNLNIEMTRLLVEKGANTEATDQFGWTALHFAADNLNIEMARLLVENGANIEATDHRGWTALHFAANILDGMEMARLLIDKGANIEATDRCGWTALHSAANSLNIEVARYLVEKGATVNATTPSNSSTPLLLAIDFPRDGVKLSKDDQEGLLPRVCNMASLLLEVGADINARDVNGKGVLHRAIESSIKTGNTRDTFISTALCELLVEKGADVEARDQMGLTPLHTAAQSGCADGIVKLLLDAGADAEATDNENNTPLSTAIVKRKLFAVQELLKEGADIGDIKCPNSPFSVSRRYLEAYLEWTENKLQTPPPEVQDQTYDYVEVVVNHWMLSRFAIGLGVSGDEATGFFRAVNQDMDLRPSTVEPESHLNHYRWLKCLLEKAIDGTMAEWPAYIASNKITQAEWDQRLSSWWHSVPLPEVSNVDEAEWDQRLSSWWHSVPLPEVSNVDELMNIIVPSQKGRQHGLRVNKGVIW